MEQEVMVSEESETSQRAAKPTAYNRVAALARRRLR